MKTIKSILVLLLLTNCSAIQTKDIELSDKILLENKKFVLENKKIAEEYFLKDTKQRNRYRKQILNEVLKDDEVRKMEHYLLTEIISTYQATYYYIIYDLNEGKKIRFMYRPLSNDTVNKDKYYKELREVTEISNEQIEYINYLKNTSNIELLEKGRDGSNKVFFTEIFKSNIIDMKIFWQ
ncbi:hypothetical protein [Paenimyroides ceti]